jgi:hypothetical protein
MGNPKHERRANVSISTGGVNSACLPVLDTGVANPPAGRVFSEGYLMRLFAIAALAAGALSLGTQAASADTYRMPVKGGDTILKVYVDFGKARRVGYEDGAVIYEVEMRENACSSQVRLVFTDATNLTVNYNVCSEQGFGLRKVYN